MKVFTLILLSFLCFSATSLDGQIVILEDFESGIPSTWTTSSVDVITRNACNGSIHASANMYTFINSASLTSPIYISNGSIIEVNFDHSEVPYSTNDIIDGALHCEYSTDSGSSWITILSTTVTELNNCKNYSSLIPNGTVANGTSFQVRFKFDRNSGDYFQGIGNVSIRQLLTDVPSCTVLSEPANGATEISVNDTLIWKSVYGATGYNLNVGTTPGGSDVINNEAVGNVTTYNIGVMDYDKTYFVTISPTNTFGTALACTEVSFTTEPEPIEPVEPPVNNDCSGALDYNTEFGMIPSAGSCPGMGTFSLDFSDFSDSSSMSSCSGPNIKTAWYKWTATYTELKLSSANYLYRLEVLDGSCDNLTSKGCLKENGIVHDLTIGNTYYLVISTYYLNSGPVEWCLEEGPLVPSNNKCANATPISASMDSTCNNFVSGTTFNAYYTQNINCISKNIEVWYSFTPLTTDYYELQTTYTSGYNPHFISVWSGSCDSLTQLNYYYNCFSSSLSQILLTANTTYLVAISQKSYSASKNFDLCIYPSPAPPANDLCANAIPITASMDQNCMNKVSGSMIWARPSSDYCYPVKKNQDIWYSFTPTISGNYAINQTSTSDYKYDVSFAVWNGQCGSLNEVDYSCNSDSITRIYLLADTTYLISLAYYDNYLPAPSYIEFCVYLTPPSPTNNLCSGAIPISVSTDDNCNNKVSGTTAWATISSENICPARENEVWYSFSPTTSGYYNIRSTAINSNPLQYLALSIWKGNCDSGPLVNRTCTTVYSQINLFADSTYLICVNSNESVDFELCISHPPPPPANDFCSGAIPITTSINKDCNNKITGTFKYTTYNPDNNTCGSRNLWYSFTPTTTGDYEFIHEITKHPINQYPGTPGTPWWMSYIYVWSGSCGALTQVNGDCSTHSSSKVYLTANTTYFIELTSITTGIEFTLCAFETPPIPVNDLCSNAIIINASTDYHCNNELAGTTTSATHSPENTCFNSNYSDVWYSFTPDSTSVYNISATGSTSISIWSGSCDSLKRFRASCNKSSISNIKLTGGTTYLISVANSSDVNFNLCIYPTPVIIPINDLCSNAIPITASSDKSCNNSVSGTIWNATSSIDSDCNGYEVWYSFTPTTSGLYEFTFDKARIGIWSGSCGSLTQINSSCKSQIYLTADSTYLISVIDYYRRDFELCIYLLPLASNDLCVNPTTIIASTDQSCDNKVSGSTTYATATIDKICSSTDKEVWYSFTPTTSSNYEIYLNITNGSQNSGISVWRGGCDSLTQLKNDCLNDSITQLYLLADSTYLISVDGGSFDFDLCIRPSPPPPPNNLCSGATTILASTDQNCNNSVSGTTIWATNTSDYSCSPQYKEVWYSFTPTTTSAYEIKRTATNSHTDLSVWTGNCGALTQVNLNCYDTILPFVNLTANITYFISVTNYAPVDFDLCITQKPIQGPPTNDLCSNATTIMASTSQDCKNKVLGTTASATNTSDYPCSSAKEVWYSFTPTTSDKYDFQCTVTNNNSDTYISVWRGDCGTLTQVNASCTSNNLSNIYLSQDSTYLISVASATVTDFQLCVYPPLPPVNNLCSNATTITASTDQNCDNIVSGTTSRAIHTSDYSCFVSSKEVWYSFTPLFAGSYDINITTNNSSAAYLSVWSGNCGSLTQVSSNCNSTSALSHINLEAGSTYLICIASFTTVDFNLCVYKSPKPINDNCTDAINIWNGRSPTVSNGQIYSEANATSSSVPPPSCHTNGILNDLWFSLDDLVPGYELTVTIDNGWYEPVLVLYEKSCDQLKEVSCVNAPDIKHITFKVPLALFQGSDPSPSYLVRVYNKFDKATPETFKITASIKVDPSYYSQLTSTILPTFNLLTWNKAHHDGTGDYILEKSIDGQHFKKIGTISNHTDASNYQFRDEHPDLESFYRLKSFASDGSVIYSDINYVIREDYHAQKVLNVYPVPTLDILQVQVASTEATDATLEILDLSGKVLHLENLRLEKGTYDYELDLSSLTNGTYLGRLNDQVFKVVIQK